MRVSQEIRKEVEGWVGTADAKDSAIVVAIAELTTEVWKLRQAIEKMGQPSFGG